MYLSGYPCDDLVLRDDFMDDVAAGIDQLAAVTSDGGPAIVVGAPTKDNGAIYNSVFVLDDGKQIARFDKVNLPIMACLMTNEISARVRCRGQLCFVG